eukprot:scaffold56734_cov41-Cyclotella_meneghiniana.AAC.2
MSHQGNKRQKHSPSSSGPSDPETAPHENKDSLRAELQNDFQSQVDQLKDKIAQLEGEASHGEAEKLELKQSVGQLENENSQLKSKVANLEEKVKSLENSVNKAEIKSKYLEIITTTSELMSVGYNDDQSIKIYRQIFHLNNNTTQMRKGKAMSLILMLNHGYYEGLLPHYRQFTDALMEYQHTIDYMEDDTFIFRMRGAAQLPAQVLLWLEKALKHTHFHRLEFNPVQTEGVRYLDFIFNCVRVNSRLQVFQLEDTIENSRDIDLLCEVLNNKASLELIKLMSCGTEEGVFREIFNKLRTQNVFKIVLSENRLSNLRPTDMSEFLSSNPSLEELDLSLNPFNEQDIVYIADALRHNTTLRRLRFRFPDPPTNWNLLESAIFDSTSLNAAYNSNHHCCLYIFFAGRACSDIYNFNTCNDPTLNRRKKIYTLLSKRNRRRENASFFDLDGIGIKHIPQILSLLKTFSEHSIETGGRREVDEVKPLSIAYEIMRDWRMPELYYLDQMEED